VLSPAKGIITLIYIAGRFSRKSVHRRPIEMRVFILILLTTILVSGCSSGVVTPDTEQIKLEPRIAVGPASNQCIWGNYTIRIKGDLSSAEVIPRRESSLHLNVTRFVEGPPCPNCMWVGKPHAAANGTFKLKITLIHPYAWNPEYTGFDVRGITMFKATEYWEDQIFYLRTDMGDKLLFPMLLNYSDPNNGGAALLNADGYTVYLNPLIEYPGGGILNYSKGKYAYGDNVDSVINPYILFADQSPRRMFKTNDMFVREYHLKPPAWGEDFEFGYVISACWAKPTVEPVTNPETDFPVNANCEDPYEISIVQLQPIKYSVGTEPVFKITIKHSPGNVPGLTAFKIPSLSSGFDYEGENILALIWSENNGPHDDVNYIDDETTELTMRIQPAEWQDIGDGLEPGYHLAMFLVSSRWSDGTEEGYLSQMRETIGVQPLQVYVEADE
jgi:hypothetical protein